jgi:ABC-type sugar transport system permease subunit
MELARPLSEPEKKSGALWRQIVKARWPYLFISPFYILFAIFGFYPMLLSIYLSFAEWKGLGPIELVGLQNFERMVSDKVFWQSMLNGAILFIMYVPIMLFLALVLAVILNSGRIRGYRFFRTLIFVPFITNMVAAGFAFRILFTQNNGLINIALEAIGLPPAPWLESVWGARVSLSILIIWAWLGYNMVLMLAGLQTIPKDLTEAAMVDGASPVRSFFAITVPLMRPVILFCAVTSTIGSFGLFAEVMALTGGGPVNATLTPLLRIYNVAFANLRFGYAAALSYVFFAFIFAATLLQYRFFGREQ